jgi:23S rRNA (cytosine1962-C5)-methyltransferase
MHARKLSDKKSIPLVFTPKENIDYQLIDCGNRRKLERFGSLILNRPEVEAHFPSSLNKRDWEKADWFFYEEKGKKGRWIAHNTKRDSWEVNYQFKGVSLQFKLQLTAFKHVGLFPEQAENWNFICKQLDRIKGEKRVLNLFAYTGAASIVAAAKGAKVTNIDSVKQVLNWGRENAELNKLDSIRWIQEDARKFVKKALRRNERFHGIILDPPAFGYGAKNEQWKLERDLKALLQDTIQLLHPKEHFFILNTYSPQLNPKELQEMLGEIKGFPRRYELSTLGSKSEQGQILPLGNLLRFTK